jgi:hypothetical protein
LGPQRITAGSLGNVYLTDPQGIKKIDGTRVAALNPSAIACESAGDLYLADWNYTFKLIPGTGVLTRFAGNGAKGFSDDGGPAIGATLEAPTGITVNATGDVYIAGGMAGVEFRRVDASTGGKGDSGDGGLATKAQMWPIRGHRRCGKWPRATLAFSMIPFRKASQGTVSRSSPPTTAPYHPCASCLQQPGEHI